MFAPGWSEAERKTALETIAKNKDKEVGEKVNSFTIMIVPTWGLGIEIAPKASWDVGGSGSATWTNRRITTATWDVDKQRWAYMCHMTSVPQDRR